MTRSCSRLIRAARLVLGKRRICESDMNRTNIHSQLAHSPPPAGVDTCPRTPALAPVGMTREPTPYRTQPLVPSPLRPPCKPGEGRRTNLVHNVLVHHTTCEKPSRMPLCFSDATIQWAEPQGMITSCAKERTHVKRHNNANAFPPPYDPTLPHAPTDHVARARLRKTSHPKVEHILRKGTNTM